MSLGIVISSGAGFAIATESESLKGSTKRKTSAVVDRPVGGEIVGLIERRTSPVPAASRKHVYSSFGPRSDKRQTWQDIITDLYGPIDIHLPNGGPQFKGEIHRFSVGRAELTQIWTDGEIARRGRQHLSKDDEDFFFFGLGLSGSARCEQYGRDCVIEPNRFGLIYSGSPYQFTHHESISQLSFRIPRAALEARVVNPHVFCGVAQAIGPGLPTLLAELLMSVAKQGSDFEGLSGSIIEANLLDMIGLLFEQSRERKLVAGTSVRWALHRRAIAYLREALSRPNLTPEVIANGLGISTRYLHRVFEDAEETVAETLMHMRLDRSWDHLIDPMMKPVSIKEIAFATGFKSQSHFASAFKSRMGVSPRELRQATFATDPEGADLQGSRKCTAN